ncbi:PREDICTED: uncharacterized protein LOC109178449 [Ipomoea nil]|uniref:uncharacterized protein LOC109178449 n=1 Tax=Ipomoea nil TaxID=35883 RepID=UPI0009014160|nr:PREDICTED: uncharacterized protein LOC109178449 [Ipomoea nil]
MAQPYPLDLRIPGNKEYDGRTDPEVHINTYYGNMLMMGVTDAMMCRAFYSTLSGQAAEWFRTLQPGSISDFASLATKFTRKFVTSKVVRKPYMYLEKAKQLEGESLTDFLVKWKAAVGEVEPMDDLTAIHMLHISLRAGYLYHDFIFHPPTTYEEALRRVTDYANAGEANAVKRSQESARKCYTRAVNRRDAGSSRVNTIIREAVKDRKEQPEPSEEIEEVPLSEDRPERKIKIGWALTTELRLEVLAILREFADIFAWGPDDMSGIDRTVICHRLAVDPAAKPIV